VPRGRGLERGEKEEDIGKRERELQGKRKEVRSEK
jgi:hypothetical protein